MFMFIHIYRLSCIKCFQSCMNLDETSCCRSLICISCKNVLSSPKCPSCNKLCKFVYSKLVKKIALSSVANCPLCKYSTIYERLPNHIKDEHKQEMKDFDNILKNKNLFELILYMNGIQYEKKFTIHDHPLYLKQKDLSKALSCNFGATYKYPPCSNFSYNSSKNTSKSADVEDNNNNHNSELNEKENIFSEFKKKFKEKFEYYCPKCDTYFCHDCLESINETNYRKVAIKASCHPHKLVFLNSNTGWNCDGNRLTNTSKCYSNITDYHQTNDLLRFQCRQCDFDLCAKCSEHYFIGYDSTHVDDKMYNPMDFFVNSQEMQQYGITDTNQLNEIFNRYQEMNNLMNKNEAELEDDSEEEISDYDPNDIIYINSVIEDD